MQASTMLFVVLLAYCVTSSRVSALKCYHEADAVEQVNCNGTCVESVRELPQNKTGNGTVPEVDVDVENGDGNETVTGGGGTIPEVDVDAENGDGNETVTGGGGRYRRTIPKDHFDAENGDGNETVTGGGGTIPEVDVDAENGDGNETVTGDPTTMTMSRCLPDVKVSPGCCTGQQILNKTCPLTPAAIKHPGSSYEEQMKLVKQMCFCNTDLCNKNMQWIDPESNGKDPGNNGDNTGSNGDSTGNNGIDPGSNGNSPGNKPKPGNRPAGDKTGKAASAAMSVVELELSVQLSMVMSVLIAAQLMMVVCQL